MSICAAWINSIIGLHIYLIQVGFLKRYLADNIRWLQKILDYVQTQNKALFLFFVHAKKIFDRADWEFFKLVLEEMHFWMQFKTWIQIIYIDQKAKVSCDSYESAEIVIYRGVTQSCPMSPIFCLT